MKSKIIGTFWNPANSWINQFFGTGIKVGSFFNSKSDCSFSGLCTSSRYLTPNFGLRWVGHVIYSPLLFPKPLIKEFPPPLCVVHMSCAGKCSWPFGWHMRMPAFVIWAIQNYNIRRPLPFPHTINPNLLLAHSFSSFCDRMLPSYLKSSCTVSWRWLCCACCWLAFWRWLRLLRWDPPFRSRSQPSLPADQPLLTMEVNILLLYNISVLEIVFQIYI